MSGRFAKVLSYLFHPVLLPLLAAFILLNTETYVAFSITRDGKYVIYGILAICTTLLPVMTSLFLLRLGMIGSLHMQSREERRIPFLATAVFYTVAYFVLSKLPLPRIVLMLQLGATLAVVLVLLINLNWKISVHMTGIGGFAGAIMGISLQLGADMRPLLALSLLVAGLLGSARLSLEMHKPAQVYAGFALGFCCEWLTLSAI